MEVRENQAGLALLVMDHGLIYAQKGFQRDALVFGMEHTKKPLCITPCFKIFHTEENYKAILLAKRFST